MSSHESTNDFSVSPDSLHHLMDRDGGILALRGLGGVQGLSRALRTDLVTGLSDDARLAASRVKVFGKNKLPPPHEVSFFELLIEALSDKMVIVLIISAVLSLILGLTVPDPITHRIDWEHGWIEGTAIIASVAIVSLVTSTNNYQKEKRFRELSASAPQTKIMVTRSGVRHTEILDSELLVGDLVEIVSGQVLPADAVLVRSQGIKVDESAATGENDDISKASDGDPFLRSGSNVVEGEGVAMITGVGVNSFAGRIAMQCREEKADTPLQESLAQLADSIGYIGMGAAFLMFAALASIELYDVHTNSKPIVWRRFLDMLTTAVTIVVVAVPEGLPLSVTIALAYSMKQMLRENNLVRHLAACETMGGATVICTDKTGTLTQNIMAVVAGSIGGRPFKLTGSRTDDIATLSRSFHYPGRTLELFREAISVNTTAIKKRVSISPTESILKYSGNKTEQALLNFVEKLPGAVDPIVVRTKLSSVAHTYPFTSAKKRMTTCVLQPGGTLRYHVKGASEMVLELCTHVAVLERSDVNATPITDSGRAAILKVINEYARNRLRTIAIASADVAGTEFPADDDQLPPLTLLGIVGIEDPIRPEVEPSVAKCKTAGVRVCVVTGDNKATAISIARKAGIYGTVYSGPCKGEQGLAIEGRFFREIARDKKKFDILLPRLQVLARASPLDKQILVSALMQRGEVVAVTGDGTNDAPALKNANVGFAMQTGTDVAKKASDVVILDDNFRSVVTAIKWGRNVRDSIAKFIQFQMTVNVAAVTIAFVGALTSGRGESPLKPVQLLWLNLIMDTMAALALATETPSEQVLLRDPLGRTSPLITARMWRSILGQAAYQIALQLWLLHAGHKWLQVSPMSPVHLTVIFNIFVLTQVFNEFNARVLDDSLNPFVGLAKAPIFLLIIVITVIVQILGILFGGDFMHTVPLNASQWMKCVACAAVSLPLGILLRSISVPSSIARALERLTTPPAVDNDKEEASDEVALPERARPSLADAVSRVLIQLRVVGALSSQVVASRYPRRLAQLM